MPTTTNQFPLEPAPYRIALIGEAFGVDEDRFGRPFIGTSGRLLNRVAREAGITRELCFVGNVCQAHPPGDNLSVWGWEDGRVQDGIAQLLTDLRTFAPHLVVALGNVPLHLFKYGNVAPARAKAGFRFPSSITKWRGTLFTAHATLSGIADDRAGVSSPPSAPAGVIGDPAMPSQHPGLPSGGESDLPLFAGVRFDQPCAVRTRTSAVQDPAAVGREEAKGADVTMRVNPSLTALPGSLPSFPPPPSSSSPDLLRREPTTPAVVGGGLAPIPTPWKCLATVHPAFCVRAKDQEFNLRQDLVRAREEGEFPELALPTITILWGPVLQAA